MEQPPKQAVRVQVCSQDAGKALVTGTAPDATVDLCVAVARERGKSVRVDLLGTSPERQRELLRHRDAIFGIHVSKDVQESGGTGPARMASRLPDWVASYHVTAGAVSRWRTFRRWETVLRDSR
jgi:3-keto-L-gulonate-6-phosphate decarboxylase